MDQKMLMNRFPPPLRAHRLDPVIDDRPSVLVAQLGARRHYAVPRALHAAGLLHRFITDACASIPPWRWLDLALPSRSRPDKLRRLLDRDVADVPSNLIYGFPWFAAWAIRKNGASDAQCDRWARRNAAFGDLVDRSGKLLHGFRGLLDAFGLLLRTLGHLLAGGGHSLGRLTGLFSRARELIAGSGQVVGSVSHLNDGFAQTVHHLSECIAQSVLVRSRIDRH